MRNERVATLFSLCDTKRRQCNAFPYQRDTNSRQLNHVLTKLRCSVCPCMRK